MYDLLVAGGTAVSPAGSIRANLVVDSGRVIALTADRPGARRVISADGLLVLPGMVDEHVHFMDPGPTEREDFITGSSAAAVGGVTTEAITVRARSAIDRIGRTSQTGVNWSCCYRSQQDGLCFRRVRP